MSLSKRRLTALVLLFVFVLGGCSLRAPMKRFATKEEIGTVHVAVQSIAKFDDEYTDQLQPRFELTAADALNAAVAQTQVSEMERFRALLAELKAAGDKKTLSTERVTDKGEVTTDKVTKKRDTGDPSTVGVPDAEERSNDAPDVLTDANVQFDPGLRYRTAAALLQEVALFNRYVRDAAVTRGSVPYVVRLLITVNPSARREPYDVYTTISFFTTGEHDTSSAEYTARLFSVKSYKDELSKLTRGGETTTPAKCDDAVEIIPLFVTDNIESSLNSVANERVVDVSGGFSAWLSHLAAVFGFRGQATDRDRSLARALNGLTTISRVGNNTVLARLGAASANNQYEMIARTYNVTLLALVPSTAKLAGYATNVEPGSTLDYITRNVTPCREIAFAAHSTFRDAERGTEARTAALKRRNLLFASMANAWGVKQHEKPAAVSTLEKLLPYAQFGDYAGFRSVLAGLPADDPFKVRNVTSTNLQYTLWHDLVALDDKSGRSYGTFELPEPASQFFASQDVTLYDDDKITTVVLNNARNLGADGLHARIHAATATSEVILDETNVTISPDRRRATFTFPSLQARLGKKETEPFTRLEFEATKQESGVRGENSELRRIARDSDPSYRFIKAAPREVALTMSVPSKNILIAKGAGELAVGFTSDDPGAAPPVLLEIEGGTVSTVSPAAPFAGGALQLNGHGTYVIALKNLFIDTKVKIKAKRANGKLIGEQTLTVRE